MVSEKKLLLICRSIFYPINNYEGKINSLWIKMVDISLFCQKQTFPNHTWSAEIAPGKSAFKATVPKEIDDHIIPN